MATLSLHQLEKSYSLGKRRHQVIKGIDLTLNDNEFVSIVGSSGCGKSTLLSIAAGLEEFDAGDVRVDGKSITGPGIDRGVVFQSYTLLPWLTARQNIEFALKAAGTPSRHCRDIAQVHLELVAGIQQHHGSPLVQPTLEFLRREPRRGRLTRIDFGSVHGNDFALDFHQQSIERLPGRPTALDFDGSEARVRAQCF